mmetsp:Transcript_31952/g.28312  ORF Transcript_31952/g.28312 Transcript_31952/m.28312 type:complete len:93 (+) Transcript_31952:441-719(+)
MLISMSGLGGNLFSAGFSDRCGITAGASTCLMGVLAFQIIWFVAGWSSFGKFRWMYAGYLGIFTLFILLGGFIYPESAIDSWGHIGAFITGL